MIRYGVRLHGGIVLGKIQIVLAGLKGEVPGTELCRREGISESVYFPGDKWEVPLAVTESWEGTAGQK